MKPKRIHDSVFHFKKIFHSNYSGGSSFGEKVINFFLRRLFNYLEIARPGGGDRKIQDGKSFFLLMDKLEASGRTGEKIL